LNESQRYLFKCFWALCIIFSCFHIFFLYKQLICIYSSYIRLLWIITNFKSFFYFIFLHILLPCIFIFILKFTKFYLVIFLFFTKNKDIFLVNIKNWVFNCCFKFFCINNLFCYARKYCKVKRINKYNMKLGYNERDRLLFLITLRLLMRAINIIYYI
jgi:hypothetical protein